MDGSIHGGDGSEVDHLHLTLEVGVADNLARCGRVHAQHLAISQIQHVAAIQLRSHAVSCHFLAPFIVSNCSFWAGPIREGCEDQKDVPNVAALVSTK